jgi:single-stranded-DNA-specific exonuclease
MTDDESRLTRIKSIANQLGISDLAARILYARGIVETEQAHRFLHPKLEHLSDPFLLPDMEKGVARTMEAIQKKEKICLYGDYDADGVTSVALMVNFLRHLGITAEVYIPGRREGYGLNVEAVKELSGKGVSLLMCLDCGSTNVAEIAEAKKRNIDTIVLDHHEVSEVYPVTQALINPKRIDSHFPTRDLAACGVTFFFLLALRRSMSHQGFLELQINLKNELDLVTVGTVGDMVPLTNDNRIMVKFGMEIMRKKPRAWLKSFFSERIIYRGTIDEYSMSFIIIPRINAAGRVSDARQALEFLTCQEERPARAMLRRLHETNRKRQAIEEDTVREILHMLEKENLADKKSIVLFNRNWHIGVIGIVAQKLVEMSGKPSIIFTEVGGHLKGSGRGGEGVDLYDTIASLSSLMLAYGGHKYACGISLSRENLLPFAEAFEESVTNRVTPRQKDTRVDTAAYFEELTSEFLAFMEHLSPFGIGNPRPNLLFPPSSISTNNRFVKITDGKNTTWHGSMQTQCSFSQNGPVRIVASPVLKEQMGERFIHLNIKDILPVDGPE